MLIHSELVPAGNPHGFKFDRIFGMTPLFGYPPHAVVKYAVAVDLMMVLYYTHPSCSPGVGA